jgi:oligo-1,6-glucosidase
MNKEVISKYDMMTVGEGPGISPEQALDYVGEDRDELHTIYHFDHMDIDRDAYEFFKIKKYDLVEFKAIVANWDRLTHMGGWNTAFLGNHDFPRIVSRFGNDKEFRKESAKLLGMFILTQRGVPYIYFGEEIGMTNVPWESLDKYRDLQVFDGHQKHLAAGGNEEEFLKSLKHTSRDNARTPMQWDDSENAGFTTGKPWIDVNPSYKKINVKEAQEDPNSVLNFYKKMLKFRRASKTLVYGDFQDLMPNDPNLFVYTRIMGDERFLVTLNFSDHNQTLKMPEGMTASECVICNYPDCVKLSDELNLRPWEACLLRLD